MWSTSVCRRKASGEHDDRIERERLVDSHSEASFIQATHNVANRFTGLDSFEHPMHGFHRCMFVSWHKLESHVAGLRNFWRKLTR